MLIPHVIMTKTSLDYTKHFRTPLIKHEKIYRQYVHTNDNSNHLKNLIPRNYVTIALDSTVKIQGS